MRRDSDNSTSDDTVEIENDEMENLEKLLTAPPLLDDEPRLSSLPLDNGEAICILNKSWHKIHFSTEKRAL